MISKNIKQKKCFVISPIGRRDSKARIRSDDILKKIIKPVMKSFNYHTIRADEISKPGKITEQIIKELSDADIVIADLTDHNPNVFYELGVRQLLYKPYIQIICEGQKIPFDVSEIRTIDIDYKSNKGIKRCKRDLSDHIKSIEDDPTDVVTPLLSAISESSLLSISRKLGIRGLHKRGDDETERKIKIIENSKDIMIMAVSAKSFFHHLEGAFVNSLLKHNLKIQILLATVKSEFVKDVEIAEGKHRINKISKEIEDTEDQIVGILEEALNRSNISNLNKNKILVANYRSALRNFIIICDNKWGWLTLNMPPKRAVENFSFKFKSGLFLNDCLRHFNKTLKSPYTQKKKIFINKKGEVIKKTL